ncbi:hypothetical protein [Amnibacterium endophyticum]|uniref:Uncharacterized protein n=1 Tax=Amnibacterium endophyticum TaxID=2109337 RepID=A0ABW4LBL3_9MICO
MSDRTISTLLQRMQRAAERVRIVDGDYRVQLMRAMRQRDEAIVAAARAGVPISEIAEAVQLSRPRTKQIIIEDKWR